MCGVISFILLHCVTIEIVIKGVKEDSPKS